MRRGGVLCNVMGISDIDESGSDRQSLLYARSNRAVFAPFAVLDRKYLQIITYFIKVLIRNNNL